MVQLIRKIEHLNIRAVSLSLIVASVIALLLESGVLVQLNKTTVNTTLRLLTNQITTILENNESQEKELVTSLKEEYIVRAKAAAYFLTNDPTAQDNITELVRLSDLLEVDELHIFNAEGTIISGTEPKYYGISITDGEQIGYFEPMLEDKTLSMCQDVTPNTAEGKSMMYAMTWNENGTEMVQVGIQPTRLLEELKNNEISNVMQNIPEYKGYEIYVADNTEYRIEGATDENTTGKLLDELSLNISQYNSELAQYGWTMKDGFRVYYVYQECGDHIILITHSTGNDLNSFLVTFGITLLYLTIAMIIIYIVVSHLIRSNDEKNKQLSILRSIADNYYSMHLINLKRDSVVEYRARDEVKKIANHKYGAAGMMRDIIYATIVDKYLQPALEFTDLTTLAERMKDKKIISTEFIGRRIGWTLASFITLSTDSEGRPIEVMFITRCVEDAKRREEALIKTSNTDELTGLLNRRAYENKLKEYAQKDLPENLVYGAFDVNGLKKVNDNLGHAAGDEIIIGAANCLEKSFSGYGKVYRIGGDEFAAILFADAAQVEEIRKKLAEVTDAWRGQMVATISISSGFVAYGDVNTHTIHEMSVLADQRMYECKDAYYRENGLDRRKR